MAGLNKILVFGALLINPLSLSAASIRPPLLEVLEDLQNDLSGAEVRGHLSDDDRSRLLEINGVLAVNLGRQRNKKPVDEKEMKSTMKAIEKLVKKQALAREDAVKLDMDLDDLKYRLSHH